MLSTMQLGTRSVCLPTCPNRAVLSSKRVDHALPPHPWGHTSHSIARFASARRGSLLCAAAKRSNAKKKAAAQKGKPKATVKDRPQAPDAPPAQGSTSTRDRSALQAEEQAEEQAQERQQQEQQQHEQPQQAEADSEPAGQPEREPVQAGMQQVAEPLAEPPSAPDSSYAQRQEQALAEARGPSENASELRQLMQQQQQSQQKPNLLQGVLQEVQLIEWPSISSVLLNTVLVFAIVAGFSALLFAVNSLLAETSQALYGGLKHRTPAAADSESTASQLPVETAPKLATQPEPPVPAPQPPTKTFQDLGPE